MKTENDTILYGSHQHLNFMDRHNTFPESFPRTYRGKQFPFLQGPPTNPTLLPGTSMCQPLLDPSSGSGSGQKLFSDDDGLNRVINSDRALSLLSSQPSETREIGLINMVHQNPISPQHGAQSLIPNLHYNSLSHYASSSLGESVGSVLVSDGSSSNTNNLHCPPNFQLGPDGSSTSASHQTLSFSWE